MIKNIIKYLIAKYPIIITYLGSQLKHEHLVELIMYKQNEIKEYLNTYEIIWLSKYLIINKEIFLSQLGQDIFVDTVLGSKEVGFFVEIGVGNGKKLSNSYFLEKSRYWNGILCEPNVDYHNSIEAIRSAKLVKEAIWSSSNKLMKFKKVLDLGELSQLLVVEEQNHDKHNRDNSIIYDVNTLSFNDLHSYHKMPLQIDYLSIDTEGSELEILKNIDFNKFNIKCITIEHNYNSHSMKSFDRILNDFGYKKFNSKLSLWDSWYYKE